MIKQIRVLIVVFMEMGSAGNSQGKLSREQLGSER